MKRKTIGDQIVLGLQGFAKTLKNNEPLEGRYTCRMVELNLSPRPYSAKEVKAVRRLLNLSQVLFARFLGVSVKTIQSWEQGDESPSGLARRFLDEIQENPKLFTDKINKAIVVK